MQDKGKNIWIGKEDLRGDNAYVEQESSKFFDLPVAQEIADDRSSLLKTSTKRRDFLKLMGFSVGAATVAASCDSPVRRAIPYVTKPDAIVPGVPTYYASTYVNAGDVLPILVKTREGRPIKIEGNKLSAMTNGGTSARAQASVLGLYDSSRFKGPMKGETKMSWSDALNELKTKLNSASSIRLVSNTTTSPLTKKAIASFLNTYSSAKHVTYDAVSSSAMLDAHESAFGMRAIPGFDFGKAKVIVSFDADFLGTWISPVEYSAGFAKHRGVKSTNKKDMNRLYSIESAMSLTGSNADNRFIVKPSEYGAALAIVYNKVAGAMGGSKVSLPVSLDDATAAKLEAIADDLVSSSRAGVGTIVVNGANNLGEQLLTIELNRLLGNYGKSIDLSRACQMRQGDDKALAAFAKEVESGSVDAVIFFDDANPLYDTPYAGVLANGLKDATTVFMGTRPSESAAASNYVLPIHHFLESWGDAEPYKGEMCLIQPVIEPLFNSKSKEEILHTLAGTSVAAGDDRVNYKMLRAAWGGSDAAWQTALHDGVAKAQGQGMTLSGVDVAAAGRGLSKPSGSEREVKFYETVNMGAGQFASNPWLQEMPDPIYRTVWDNFVTVPVFWDGNRTIEGMNGWESGDIVNVTIGGNEINAPVVDQFGVKDGCHGIALGYGRTDSGRAATGVGFNVYPFLTVDGDGYIQYHAPIDFGSKVGKDDRFASVQYHHTYGIKDEDPTTGETINVDEKSISAIAAGYQGALTDRSVLFYADLNDLKQAKEDLHHHRAHAQHLNEQTIYAGHEHLYENGHKWEMSVDLTGCTGCGACQVACVAENNVPVVGKVEVNRHHEMTWLRIDRYFFGDIESPNTAYQPMMCQHCDNAPCENVCPVGATQHSSEGLNHMTYNRCIGTRYCANNCPFKVRRFNWLDYTTADLFGANESDPLPNPTEGTPYYAENMTRMVLNPDVTVRSRGVIEKCSFCIQKIQQGKLQAKAENRSVEDGEIQTACSSACPSGCIVFGDVNNKDSEVAKLENNPLNYYVLEETNVRSAVGYLMKVTNKNEKINA